jgi:hypothetical protein
MQAAFISPEMVIVVEKNSCVEARRKPTALARRKAAIADTIDHVSAIPPG